ncbi:MAG: hypothetical protein HY711_05685 [Candidatus Melainabacteria bacterium]|nr:hypothetical protein [Candidatus Melainabacteria bacterium]
MSMYYLHTQKVPSKVMALATAAGIAIGLAPPTIFVRLALWGILGAVAASFRSLTVEVNDRNVNLRFGDGLIKKSFPLKDICSAEVVRTTPWQGWGIHWCGSGWLYNVYGLDAVEVIFNSGKRVFIGTDEPEKLTAAIKEQRNISYD